MTELRTLVERDMDRAGSPSYTFEDLSRRRERKHRTQRLTTTALALVVAAAGIAVLMRAWSGGDLVPAERPVGPVPEGPFGQVGGWIAYNSGEGIWALDPARPERRIRLSRADGDPIAWSSDGTKLLIRRGSPGSPHGLSPADLYVLEADGTETRLTDADAYLSGGSFSPDGSEVFYAAPFGTERSAIYAVSSDGGAPRPILRATRRILAAFPEEGRVPTQVYRPALSPDGTRIAYFDGAGDHSHNLWVVNADGTERRLLLDEEVSAGHMRWLTWSPDGGWLAFTTDDSIYLVRPDGTGLRLLVSGDFVYPPAAQWSPDGSWIAYLRVGPTCAISREGEEDCEAALSIVNVDGGNERTIGEIGAAAPGEGVPPGQIAWNPADH